MLLPKQAIYLATLAEMAFYLCTLQASPAPPYVGADTPVLLVGCKESSDSFEAGQCRPDYAAPLSLWMSTYFLFKGCTLFGYACYFSSIYTYT